MTPAYIPNFFKTLFTGEILYTLTLCSVKYSILAFYFRLFVKSIRIPVYVLTTLVTAWGIAVVSLVARPCAITFLTDIGTQILVSIFQCVPISALWNRSPNDSSECGVDDYAFFIGNAVPNIVTDAAILSLPIPVIWKLHRTTSQKIALSGIFMLGSLYITTPKIIKSLHFADYNPAS